MSLKPYLDVELDVLIEETIYALTKDSKEAMASYVTRKANKRIEMCNALGKDKINCPQCTHAFTHQRDLPDEVGHTCFVEELI